MVSTNTNNTLPEITKVLQILHSHTWDIFQYLSKCYVYENNKLYYKYVPILLDMGQIEPLSSEQLHNIFLDKTKYMDMLYIVDSNIYDYMVVDITEIYNATGVSQLNYSEIYDNPIYIKV